MAQNVTSKVTISVLMGFVCLLDAIKNLDQVRGDDFTWLISQN